MSQTDSATLLYGMWKVYEKLLNQLSQPLQLPNVWSLILFSGWQHKNSCFLNRSSRILKGLGMITTSKTWIFQLKLIPMFGLWEVWPFFARNQKKINSSKNKQMIWWFVTFILCHETNLVFFDNTQLLPISAISVQFMHE